MSPDHWNAHREYGWLLRRTGRYAEAVAEHERAQELDPVSWYTRSNLAAAYLLLGDVDRAIELQRETVELYPELSSARVRLGVFLAEKGRFDEALVELDRVSSSDIDASTLLASAGYVHALAGDSAEALQSIERLDELHAHQGDPARLAFSESAGWGGAMILVGLGDHEGALKRLERLAESDVYAGGFLNSAHWAAPLRDYPRYKDILRRAGLEP